ncbi:hypothetical protein [Bradyrhizobium sp. Ash2021]|uniref:hypothetical protein n=1 Tax=Bradyrhizobium sp. Ash2021 TaxID=2954771 RepID=UPI00281657A0|nr:hypothetical protein [Bradyrhizobium sp. Ash2021]WMT74239.1 hypothetical protein NL528_41160 [Bradyrhizobium sp. Ash2021]
MSAPFDSPFAVFALALLAQGLAAYIGDVLRKRAHVFRQGERHDFNTVQAATFTLLALIIGFAATTSARPWRRPKPMPSARNICVPICCRGTPVRARANY